MSNKLPTINFLNNAIRKRHKKERKLNEIHIHLVIKRATQTNHKAFIVYTAKVRFQVYIAVHSVHCIVLKITHHSRNFKSHIHPNISK